MDIKKIVALLPEEKQSIFRAQYAERSKSAIVGFFIALFFGLIGLHAAYFGKPVHMIAWILVSIVIGTATFGTGLFFVWLVAIVDGIFGAWRANKSLANELYATFK